MIVQNNDTSKISIGTILFYTTGYFLVFFVLFDLIGVILVFLTNLFMYGSKSRLYLYYPLWCVVAIFNGIVYSSFTKDKLKLNAAHKNKQWLIVSVAVILSFVALSVFNNYGQLQTNWRDNYWVPGHKGLTIGYFITLILSSVFFIKAEINKYNGN